jgi:hypothetical protein
MTRHLCLRERLIIRVIAQTCNRRTSPNRDCQKVQ